tara:strand:- start:1665 stop:1955 length:291 start_codon:yes stop_codon:yes gene_type:complete
MSKTEKILLVRVSDDEITETLSDAIQNANVERGVVKRSKIGIDMFKEFKELKERGYYPVGVIIEDGFNIEFLFQRHPKQQDNMKYVELKNPNPYKL